MSSLTVDDGSVNRIHLKSKKLLIAIAGALAVIVTWRALTSRGTVRVEV